MKQRKMMTFVTLSLLGLLFTGCRSTEKPTVLSNTSNSSSEMIEITSSSEKNNTNNTQAEELSLEEIIAIYQAEYPETSITGIDYDTSFGKWYFKVDGINDTTDFELQIEPITGEVSKKKEEMLDKDEQNPAYREKETLDLTDLAPLAEIRQAAIDSIGIGDATDLELEKELDITYWKVTIKDGNQEHEVKINAKTKEILETELDD